MTRREFIKKTTKRMIAKYPGNRFSEREVSIWVKEIIANIAETILEEDKLILTGLGTFKHRVAAPRRLHSLTGDGDLYVGERIKIDFIYSDEMIEKIAQIPVPDECECEDEE